MKCGEEGSMREACCLSETGINFPDVQFISTECILQLDPFRNCICSI
uniref:Uncharacterized protein n=1 Tax=Rhizophora mucronata TaxID=61149 RepID=A0A2P2PX37_RHIMU